MQLSHPPRTRWAPAQWGGKAGGDANARCVTRHAQNRQTSYHQKIQHTRKKNSKQHCDKTHTWAPKRARSAKRPRNGGAWHWSAWPHPKSGISRAGKNKKHAYASAVCRRMLQKVRLCVLAQRRGAIVRKSELATFISLSTIFGLKNIKPACKVAHTNGKPRGRVENNIRVQGSGVMAKIETHKHKIGRLVGASVHVKVTSNNKQA